MPHRLRPLRQNVQAAARRRPEHGEDGREHGLRWFGRALLVFLRQRRGDTRGVAPFGEYIARTQRLEGDFRRMHSRLITHAEEVAFLDGAERERGILDAKLESTTTWSQFYFYLQFKQGVVDQYFVKYFASMIGWPVLAFPFLASSGARSGSEIAARYRESDTLIQSASSSIGDLMMVYKKLQRLAGFTARVAELLEAVDSRGEGRGESTTEAEASSVGAGVISSSEEYGVRFDRVTVYAPDGRLLVKEVNLALDPGENLFVTGANGAGKTSLFRVLAGLWKPSSGDGVSTGRHLRCRRWIPRVLRPAETLSREWFAERPGDVPSAWRFGEGCGCARGAVAGEPPQAGSRKSRKVRSRTARLGGRAERRRETTRRARASVLSQAPIRGVG